MTSTSRVSSNQQAFELRLIVLNTTPPLSLKELTNHITSLTLIIIKCITLIGWHSVILYTVHVEVNYLGRESVSTVLDTNSNLNIHEILVDFPDYIHGELVYW